MTEKKAKNIIIASTIGAVLLVVILLFVMIFQFIAIGVSQREYNQLEARVKEYKELYASASETLEARSDYYWIVQRARELGYTFDGEELVPNN